MSVSCECCILSSRGLRDGLITRPEESYRTCGVSVCVRVASIVGRLWLAGELVRHETKISTLTNAHFLNNIKFLVSVVENLHIYCEIRNGILRYFIL